MSLALFSTISMPYLPPGAGAPPLVPVAAPQNSLLQDMYAGGKVGGCVGLVAGSSFAGLIGSVIVTTTVYENTIRGYGFEPQLPVSREDCNLSQFQNTSYCTIEPSSDSIYYFTAVLVASATITGTTIGAVVGAVKHFFS